MVVDGACVNPTMAYEFESSNMGALKVSGSGGVTVENGELNIFAYPNPEYDNNLSAAYVYSEDYSELGKTSVTIKKRSWVLGPTETEFWINPDNSFSLVVWAPPHSMFQ